MTFPAVADLLADITFYEKKFGNWEGRVRKIVRRYQDERNGAEMGQARYNILWSNVQTLMPALYARQPRPEVERRFRDADPVGRMASDVLQRALSYTLEAQDISARMQATVLDRLLGGRGTLWLRYAPRFKAAETPAGEVADDGAAITEDVENEAADEAEAVAYEEVAIDYVHWSDFGHAWARTWEEVPRVWRRVYLSRDELAERFGKKVAVRVPLNCGPDGEKDENADDATKKACVYEVWCKRTASVSWITKGYDSALDQKADPLGLEGFFPCPRPLYATTTTESLIPVPDFTLYQDQAEEIDLLTNRIARLAQALKVVGIYASDASGLAQMLSSGVENTMIPVDSFAMLSEKGGIRGVTDWFPVEQVASTLASCLEAREAVKRDLYEITGMADIIRGQGDAQATATQERIKGRFATLRLSSMQREVQRYVRDVVRIAGEIISEQFGPETLAQMSGMDLFGSPQEKQQAMMMLQMQGAQEIPEAQREKFESPTWQEIAALLADQSARCFRIDIETDSTILLDEEQEKADRVEFLSAVGGYLRESLPMVQQAPAMAPLLGQMLLFGIRGFRVGRELEGAFEEALDQIEQAAKQPQPEQPPDPKLLAVQAKAQADQQRIEAEIQMHRDEQAAQAAQVEQQNAIQAQRDQMQAQLDAQLEQMRAENERQMVMFQEAMKQQTAAIVASINAEAQKQAAALSSSSQE